MSCVDVHRHLSQALIGLLDPAAIALASRERAWASATFAGGRHHYTLAVPASAMLDQADFRKRLGEHQFSIPGTLVADVAVAEWFQCANGNTEIEIEALTVEEC